MESPPIIPTHTTINKCELSCQFFLRSILSSHSSFIATLYFPFPIYVSYDLSFFLCERMSLLNVRTFSSVRHEGVPNSACVFFSLMLFY